MNLYRVFYDGLPYFVEAPSFGKAIEAWQNWAAKHWEDDGWEGDEQPESVELLDSQHRVIRADVVLPCPRATGRCGPCRCGRACKPSAPELIDEHRARKTVAVYENFGDLERAF